MSKDLVLGIKINVDGKEADGTIKVITSDISQLAQSTKNSGDESERSYSKTRKGLESISNQLASARKLTEAFFAAQAAWNSVSSVTQIADQYSSMAARIKLATTSAQEYTTAQAAVAAIAQQTQAGIDDIGKLYARLADSSRAAGNSQQDLLKVVESVANSGKVSGASVAEMSSTVTQLTQVLGSGSAQWEDFGQLTDTNMRLVRTVIKGLGTDIGQLKQDMGDGKISSQQVFEAILRGYDDLKAESAKMPKTVGGSVVEMKNAFELYIGKVDQARGISSGLAGDISDLSHHMDDMAVAAGAVAGGMTVLFSASMIANIGGVAGALGKVNLAMAAMSRHPILALATVAGTVLGAKLMSDADLSRLDKLKMDLADLEKQTTHPGFMGPVAGRDENRISAIKAEIAEIQRRSAAEDAAAQAKAKADREERERIQREKAGKQSVLASDIDLLKARGQMRAAYELEAKEVKNLSETDRKRYVDNHLAIDALKEKTESAKQATTEADSAAKALQNAYDNAFHALEREVALRGNNTRTAAMQYELTDGALKGLDGTMKQHLLQMAEAADANAREQQAVDTKKTAMESLIDKYNQLTLSARDYYLSTLKTKDGVPLSDAEKEPFKQQYNKNAEIANQQQSINDAWAALEQYNKTLDDTHAKTSELQSVTSAVFDGALGGINLLAGAFDQLVGSIEATTREHERLNAVRAQLDVTQPDASKGITDEYIKSVKIKVAAEDKYAQDVIKLNNRVTQEKLSGTRQIAGAVASMLDKNSSEYKVAHAIEMGLAGAELAMQVMKITGIGAETAANVQSVVPYVGATMTKAEADATAGVASQAKAGPFIGFALMAAMAAAMASLGLMSGKSSVSAGPQGLSPDSGTVLGDSSAKSQSIDKTYQLLQDIHAEEYATLRSIDQGIAGLHTGITDVVTRLFQGGGLKAPVLPADGMGKTILSAVNAIDPGHFLRDIDPIGSKVMSFLFGGKQTSTVIAQGIATSATALADILAGGNLSAQQFAQIETKTKGGFFSKDKYSISTQYSALDAATQKALNDVFKSMGNTMFGLADSLGFGLSDRVRNYIIPGLTVDLKGLDGEAASKKLNGVLSAALDTMSSAVFGDILGQYQQLGEGMLETATRVVAEIAVVQDALSKSGLSIAGDAIAISDGLAQAAGGLKEFQVQFDSYYQKFYSEAERAVFTQKSLNSQLSDVNLILPATRDGYRKVVEALDINNAADQQRYSMLLKLSDAADSYYQTIESQAEDAQRIAQQRRALDIEYMTLSSRALGALIERRKDELAALDPSLRFHQQAVWAAAEANKAIDDAMSVLKKSVADQKALNAAAHKDKMDALAVQRQAGLDALAVQKQASLDTFAIQKQAAADLLNSLKTVAGNIKTALGSTQIASQAYTRKMRTDAQAVLAAALSSTRAGGSLANFQGLEQALTNIAKPSEQLYASFVEYALDQARTGAVIADLGEHAAAQISVADATVTAIEANTKQLSASIEANTKQLSADFEVNTKQLSADLEAGNAALDALITTAQAQIDAARGTTAEVMSVKDAIENLANALEVRSQTLKAIEAASAATAFADAAKKIADDANSKAQSSGDALAAQIALSDRAAQAAADAQRNATAKATWQPAPDTWRNGQTNNPLWERVLSEFNAWHAGRYGIEMNRPWSADGDARAAYGRLVAQYNAMSASAAAAAQASASALAATADAIKTAIPDYQAAADADARAASAANADAAAKAAAAGAAQSVAVGYMAPGGAGVNKIANTFYNAKTGQIVDLAEKKQRLLDAQAAGGFGEIYARVVPQGLDSTGLDLLMDWAPGTSAQKAVNWKLPAFASGGEHTGGFRLVGEQGPEIEFTPPSRIFSHSQSKSLVDNSELVDEIKALKAVVADLRGELSEIKKNTGGTESNSRRVADQLRSMTPDGQSLRVTTA